MSAPAQFDFMDGGERSGGSVAYYAPLGVSAVQCFEVDSLSFFTGQNPGAPGVYTPASGFSSSGGFFGSRLYLNDWPCSLALINSAGQEQLVLNFNPNGSMSLYAGSTLLGTSAPNVVFVQAIFYVAIGFLIDPAAGHVTVKLNGNPTPLAGVSVSGVDTAPNTANLPISGASFISSSAFGAKDIWFRDIYFHDGTGAAPFNTFLGNGRCILSTPTANVSVQFTPNGNSQNWENAAENPPNPTVDYNSSATVGQADVFTIAPLPSNVETVIGVKVFNLSAKSDAGARAINNTLESGGVTIDGVVTYLSESPIAVDDVIVVDPATSAPFTVDAFNAMHIGYVLAD